MLIHDDETSRAHRFPIFRKSFPKIVFGLLILICAVTGVQFFSSAAQEDWLIRTFAVIAGPEYAGTLRPLGPWVPLVGHVLLHVNFLHLVMNMAALVALGPIVALALGTGVRGAFVFLAFFAWCAFGGALAELLVSALNGEGQVAIGASSALSGLLPAVGFIRGGLKGAWDGSLFWIIINLGLAVFGGLLTLPIAWAAHLGGLAAGFLFPVFLSVARRQHVL